MERQPTGHLIDSVMGPNIPSEWLEYRGSTKRYNPQPSSSEVLAAHPQNAEPNVIATIMVNSHTVESNESRRFGLEAIRTKSGTVLFNGSEFRGKLLDPQRVIPIHDGDRISHIRIQRPTTNTSPVVR